jgi:hypothetical protein
MPALVRQMLEIVGEQQREIEELRRSHMALLRTLHAKEPTYDWGGELQRYSTRSATEQKGPSAISQRIDELLQQLREANAKGQG